MLTFIYGRIIRSMAMTPIPVRVRSGDSFCGIETVEVGKTSPDRHGSC